LIINNIFLIRRFLFTLFFTLFPFVQKQWLNLHLFNTSSISIYSILYYFSGSITPLIVGIISIKRFTSYNLNLNILYKNKTIKGKLLLLFLLFTIIPLSILIAKYFSLNIYLTLSLLFNREYIFKFNLTQKIITISLICILLIFKSTRILIKKIILINFFVMTLIIWHLQIINGFEIYKFYIKDNLFLENISFVSISFINIIYLFFIEEIYYLWSYIAHKNNLTDWSVQIPSRSNLLPIIKIAIFYIFILIYYSILGA